MSAIATTPLRRLAAALWLTLTATACPVLFDDEGPAQAEAGAKVLLRTAEEPPGEACAHGGVRVEHGLDEDGDGQLSDDEVSAPPAYVCDGAPAEGGDEVLLEQGPAADGQCPAGGVVARAGVDRDGDGALSSAEVTEEALICDGEGGHAGQAGAAGLAQRSVVLPGEECVAGGQRLELGLDADGDGVLQPSEVALTRVFCHGEPGPRGDEGADGVPTLIRVTGVGPSVDCPDGGQEVALGADTDRDGLLSELEVEAVALVCDAETGSVVLGAGRNEGTAVAPVAVTLDELSPRLSTVAALGQSHYLLQTGPHAAAYTFVLSGIDSSLDVQLFTHPEAAALPLTCTARGTTGQVCTSDELAAGASYRVRVSELAEVANVFGLTLHHGAALGSDDAPVALTDAAGVTTGAASYVGPEGRSVFTLSVPSSDAYTLSLEDLTLASEDPLRWSLSSDDERLHSRCTDAHAPCVAGYLEAGVEYTLVVEAPRRGAAFSVALQPGDDLTPALPLDETVVIDDLALPEVRVFQVRTGAASAYTLRTYSPSWYRQATIFNAPPDESSGDPYQTLNEPPAEWDLAWLFPDYPWGELLLEPNRTYYLALLHEADTTAPFELRLSSRGGDEVDVPLTVDAPAHLGTVASESSYHFDTGPTASRYTVELVPDLPAASPNLELAVIDDDTGTPLALVGDWRGAHLLSPWRVVTDELPPNTRVRLEVTSYGALTYTFAVKSGDLVSVPLDVDDTEDVALAANDFVIYSVNVAAPTPATLSATGGPLRVWMTSTWPGTGGSGALPSSFGACEGLSCSEEVVLPPGRSYLVLESRAQHASDLEVALATSGPQLTHAVPKEASLERGEVLRLWFENDLEVAHRLSLLNPAVLRVRVRVRRGSDFGLEWEHFADLEQGVISQPLLSSGSPLPVGSWILELENKDNTGGELTLNLTRP